MEFSKMQCKEFTDVLASKSPVPGGGGASALVGAVGMALGSMVGNLTIGKKKYAEVEEEMNQMNADAGVITQELLTLIDKDAEVFAPLAAAYGMPKDTEEQRAEKARVMEQALLGACRVPMEIMEKCCEAIDLHRRYADKGSALALSDAGVGVAFCRAALLGASLNVFINTKAMTDKTAADKLNQETQAMLDEYTKLADEVFADVLNRLK